MSYIGKKPVDFNDVTESQTFTVTGDLTGVNATFTTTDNSDNLTLTSTDADASSGPNVKLYRNSASPADGDALGFINFYGENDADEETLYGQIRASIADASDGTEDARFIIQTAVAGTQQTSRVELTGTETVINEDSKDLDFRVESDNNTHALFVQGSDSNVGIGTSSPQQLLEVENTGGVAQINITADQASQSILALGDENNQYVQHIVSDHSDNSLRFHTAAGSGTNERFRVDSSGKVGIGTTSADEVLEVSGDIKSSGSSFGIYHFGETSDVTKIVGRDADHASTANTMDFFTDSTQRMRIDSSGRLLIGKTTNSIGTAGHTLQADGFFSATRSAAYTAGFNRLSDDGKIVQFFKDGTGVGSINSRAGLVTSVIFDPRSGGHGLSGSGVGVLPCDENGDLEDNAMDIGNSSNRFNDAFVTNGVTTSSDQNEKQQIATLTTAEIAAAKRISNGFKTFKWNSAVTAKGDNARTHTGVIAQEVRTALEAEGLDAGDYAFFMSDTWWETQTEVPAVEAVDAVTETQTNEEGDEVQVVVKEAVEAKDAYSRRDVYDTEGEAPEGATQHTRLGIRYPELLAFIGAATEQRLTHLETLEARIVALENT